MLFGAVEIRVGSWLSRAAACTSVAFAVACAGDGSEQIEVEADDEAEAEAEAEFRLDGCGALLKKGTASQTCKFASASAPPEPDDTKAGHNFTVKASCDGDSKLKCEFSYTGCSWKTTSTTTCVKNEPKCVAPVIKPIELTKTYTLEQGDTLCDPAGSQLALASWCFHWAFQKKDDEVKVVGRLMKECLDMTTPDVTSDVTCCVKAEGGDTGGGCDGGSSGAGETMTWGTGATWGSESSSSWSGGDDAGDTTLVVEPVVVVKPLP